jgi:hypothetical protein
MSALARRQVLQGGAAMAVAALGVSGSPKAAFASVSSDLARLIKDHRVAYRAFCKAIDREQEMEAAYYKAKNHDTIIVPCLLGGGASLSQGYEFCQEHITGAYENQRDRLTPLSRVAPELAEQVRAVMDAKEAENAILVDRVFAEEEARQEAFGLAGAKRDLEATGEAEEDAAIAVCAYRCQTLEEARLKAAYLAEAPGLGDGLQPDHVKALLASFRQAVAS